MGQTLCTTAPFGFFPHYISLPFSIVILQLRYIFCGPFFSARHLTQEPQRKAFGRTAPRPRSVVPFCFLHVSDRFPKPLGVPSISILNRPNLSRKPPESQGKRIRLLERAMVEKKLLSERSPSFLNESNPKEHPCHLAELLENRTHGLSSPVETPPAKSPSSGLRGPGLVSVQAAAEVLVVPPRSRARERRRAMHARGEKKNSGLPGGGVLSTRFQTPACGGKPKSPAPKKTSMMQQIDGVPGRGHLRNREA